MKKKFWLCKRGRAFYVLDSDTGKRTTLQTSDRHEAAKLVAAKNEVVGKPTLGFALARAYLSAVDPQMIERTWTDVIGEFCKRGKPQTQACRLRMTKSTTFDLIRHKRLLETTADDFLTVLRGGGVMTHSFLRCMHNLAGWMSMCFVAHFLNPSLATPDRSQLTNGRRRFADAAAELFLR